MNNDVKIKANLFLPIEFWSNILVRLDQKVELISTTYKFGKVNLVINIHQGKISDIRVSDEAIVRVPADTG